MTTWPWVASSGTIPRRMLFTRPLSGFLSWAMRPLFLRAGFPRKQHLFAGPWVGEFGWELMNWQGFVRALRPFYKHITVCAQAPSAALYADCCDEFIPHDVQGQSNAHVVFDVKNPEELQRVLSLIPSDADHLPPLKYIPESAQRFIKFGTPQKGKSYPDVLIHARKKKTGARQDWAMPQWFEFIGRLKADSLSVGCMGLSGVTYDIEGLLDFRDAGLDDTTAAMSAAKLVAGPSSGPMHLAALCGTPHLVWTDKKTYGMRKTSREKYESWWNPLRTQVKVIDECGFEPPVNTIYQESIRMLSK